MHERREPLSGDYGYDMAHEATGGRAKAPEVRPGGRPAPPPTGHEVEYDRDMSYDEAHDFQGR